MQQDTLDCNQTIGVKDAGDIPLSDNTVAESVFRSGRQKLLPNDMGMTNFILFSIISAYSCRGECCINTDS